MAISTRSAFIRHVGVYETDRKHLLSGQRGDVANGGGLKPMNQAGCCDSRKAVDTVPSMFWINLCHRFSHYQGKNGINYKLFGVGSWKSVKSDAGL